MATEVIAAAQCQDRVKLRVSILKSRIVISDDPAGPPYKWLPVKSLRTFASGALNLECKEEQSCSLGLISAADGERLAADSPPKSLLEKFPDGALPTEAAGVGSMRGSKGPTADAKCSFEGINTSGNAAMLLYYWAAGSADEHTPPHPGGMGTTSSMVRRGNVTCDKSAYKGTESMHCTVLVINRGDVQGPAAKQ